jgi:hypothetical protein
VARFIRSCSFPSGIFAWTTCLKADSRAAGPLRWPPSFSSTRPVGTAHCGELRKTTSCALQICALQKTRGRNHAALRRVLLSNPRKTECGASLLLTPLVRAVPCALPRNSHGAFQGDEFVTPGFGFGSEFDLLPFLKSDFALPRCLRQINAEDTPQLGLQDAIGEDGLLRSFGFSRMFWWSVRRLESVQVLTNFAFAIFNQLLIAAIRPQRCEGFLWSARLTRRAA